MKSLTRFWLIVAYSPPGQLIGALFPAFGLWVWGITPGEVLFWIVMVPVLGCFLTLNVWTFVLRRREGVGWLAKAKEVADLTVAEIDRRHCLSEAHRER